MLYVQSFTLIKSTGARISSTASGIPSPTVQNIHSVYKLHSEVHLDATLYLRIELYSIDFFLHTALFV
jgi:hypothetical protein